MPLSFACVEGEFRHVTTRKFPYSIIYHPSELELVVVSCFHHRRRPGSWLRNPGSHAGGSGDTLSTPDT